MTHRLERHYPLVASLKYRCPCKGNEVLAVQVAINADTTEEHFIWTMRALWRDVRTEIEQHSKLPEMDKRPDMVAGDIGRFMQGSCEETGDNVTVVHCGQCGLWFDATRPRSCEKCGR